MISLRGSSEIPYRTKRGLMPTSISMLDLRKTAVLILILFIWSGVAIALDQHDSAYSSKCPICHTKNLLNGNEDCFELHVHFDLSPCCATEKRHYTLVPVFVPFKGRAPPALFQS